MTKTKKSPLEIFKEVSLVLKSHEIEEPEKETELLFSEVLGIPRERLYTLDFSLGEEQLSALKKAVQRRLNGEPIQYIIEYVDFMGLRFFVGSGVLIPRPETELVVDVVLRLVNEGLLRSDSKVLDIGTGSGCIAISIAYRLPDASVLGTDISEEALFYAEKNRRYHRINNVRFIKTDLFPETPEDFDLIISNPPYVSMVEMGLLDRDVKAEPTEALYGGIDGLEFYRRILSKAGIFLEKDGMIVLESGAGQSKDISAIANGCGFVLYLTERDLSGIERVLVFKRGDNEDSEIQNKRW